MLVSFADFAKDQGVSRAAITQACSGRLASAVRDVDGKRCLDQERALELWTRGSVRQARKPKAAPAAPAAPAASPSPGRPGRPRAVDPDAAAVAAEVMRLPDDAIPDLGISLERKEHYRAELAKVEAMRRREEVGSIAEMRREAFTLAKTVREGVLGVVARVSADLAAMTDQQEVEQRLEEELTVALRVLADG
jgi:hypothetical protein